MAYPRVLHPSGEGVVWGDVVDGGGPLVSRIDVGPAAVAAGKWSIAVAVISSVPETSLQVNTDGVLTQQKINFDGRPTLIWITAPAENTPITLGILGIGLRFWHCAHGPATEIPGPVAPGFTPPGIGGAEREYSTARTLAGMPAGRETFDRGNAFDLSIAPVPADWVADSWQGLADDLAAGHIYIDISPGRGWQAMAWASGGALPRPRLTSPVTYTIGLPLRAGPPLIK